MDAEITLCEALISCKQGREGGGWSGGAFIPVTNHLRFPNAVSLTPKAETNKLGGCVDL